MRIVDLLERDALLYPERIGAGVVGGEMLGYAELRARVARLAGALERRGVGRGERVALMASNGLVYFDVYLACAYLGAAAVPVNTHLALPEIAYQMDDAQPVIGVADAAHVDALHAAAPWLPLVCCDDAEWAVMLRNGVEPAGLPSRARPDDVALVIYTSGTTGRPKGVCLTQHALCFNGVSIALAQELRNDEVFLTTTPLYHAATGTRIASMLLDGYTHLVMRDFDAAGFLRSIDEHGVTSTILVPTQLRRVLGVPSLGGATLDTLRLLVYGAAPTALPLIHEALTTLPCGFYQGYGLSEACTNLTGLLPSDHLLAASRPDLLLTCGRVTPGTTLRITDDDGVEVPRGERGELRVFTEKVMAGYWGRPEATRDAIVDGWLRTGDVAVMDGEAYITIVDRAKDMLITGGTNVYPSEIEAVLHAHPDIAEAAVVGAPHIEWGEVPVAFVIARPGHSVDAAAVAAFCRTQLAGIKVPRSISVVEDMPRTANGKVRKVELREQVAAQPA
ncbi:MAG TPA: AMP-binding protein [Candidatus Dormibacteraeota bacterium]|jgi:long-chain acyl-CoA synthetase|nr:AMP-binding protein [Candidatus Dormibacteraeota bacterium]